MLFSTRTTWNWSLKMPPKQKRDCRPQTKPYFHDNRNDERGFSITYEPVDNDGVQTHDTTTSMKSTDTLVQASAVTPALTIFACDWIHRVNASCSSCCCTRGHGWSHDFCIFYASRPHCPLHANWKQKDGAHVQFNIRNLCANGLLGLSCQHFSCCLWLEQEA